MSALAFFSCSAETSGFGEASPSSRFSTHLMPPSSDAREQAFTRIAALFKPAAPETQRELMALLRPLL